MQKYEITYISTEEKGDEAVAKILSTSGAEVINHQELGKKKLAYPIKKEVFGNYFSTVIKIEPEKLQSIEKKINLTSTILRVLIVKRASNLVATLPSSEVKTAEISIVEEKPVAPTKTTEEKAAKEIEEEKTEVKKKASKKSEEKEPKEKTDNAEEEKERLKKLEEKLDQILKD